SGKLKSSRAGQEPLQRTAGAHPVTREQRGIRSLRTDQIVASVVRWSHDHGMCSQTFERLFENRRRQVRAVAVERNDAALMMICEVGKYGSEACSKTFPFLPSHVPSPPNWCPKCFTARAAAI